MEASAPTVSSLYIYKAVPIRAVDGDTVILDISLGLELWLRNVTCRLYGIDAPETHTETRLAGEQSKERLKYLLDNGKEVFIQTHYDRHDSFRRILIDLWIDGVHVNQKLIDEDFAAAKMW